MAHQPAAALVTESLASVTVSEDAFTSAARSFSGPLKLPVPAVPVHVAPVSEPPVPIANVTAPSPASPSPPALAAAPALVSAGAAASAVTAVSSPGGAARPKMDALVLRQAAAHQTQALRAMAHRAAAEMESWRVSVGTCQLIELFTYFATFIDVTSRARASNERCLAFLRAAASAAAGYASALQSASAILAPVASGEALGVHAKVLSLSVLAGGLVDVQTQAVGVAGELAGNVSRMLVGDEEGPLGRAARRNVATVGALDATAPPPGDLASVTAWYNACAADMREQGSTLEGAVREGQLCCDRAYTDLEVLISAHMSGEPRRIASVRGKDVWLHELRHRRACRALLGLKARYLTGMATLFERFRRVERQRTEALSSVCDAYSALLARAFERASPARTAVADAVRTLNTHADLCRVVDAETRTKVLELRAARERSAPTPTMAAAAPAQDGNAASGLSSFGAYSATGLSTAETRGGGGAAAVAASGGVRGAAPSATAATAISFILEAAPAVITPFASPLVVRCGVLQRQSDILKSWKPCIAVLTRDAQLHLFSGDEDVATHPDVISAFFKQGASGGAGHGGTSRDVYSFLQATQAHASALQRAEADATVAAMAGAPSGGSGSSVVAPAVARPTICLPPPALPLSFVQFAAAYAAKVDDITPAPSGSATDPLTLAKHANTNPGVTFVLTSNSRVTFVPTAHAHAFEVRDDKGLFAGGTQRLVLRAVHDADAAAWGVAITTLVETVAALPA